MALVNLTKEYLKNGSPSLARRIKARFDVDTYWASSLSALDEFAVNPPSKKYLYFMGEIRREACVYVDDVWIMRINESFDEEMPFDEYNFPYFGLKDETARRIATWVRGDEEYFIKKREFGFNTETFVKIPKILLLYSHRRGHVGVLSLHKNNQDRKWKSKDETSRNLIFFPEPAPSFIG